MSELDSIEICDVCGEGIDNGIVCEHGVVCEVCGQALIEVSTLPYIPIEEKDDWAF